jgi:hypothetical protein
MQKEKKEKGFLRNVTARWAYSHLGVFFPSSAQTAQLLSQPHHIYI